MKSELRGLIMNDWLNAIARNYKRRCQTAARVDPDQGASWIGAVYYFGPDYGG